MTQDTADDAIRNLVERMTTYSASALDSLTVDQMREACLRVYGEIPTETLSHLQTMLWQLVLPIDEILRREENEE